MERSRNTKIPSMPLFRHYLWLKHWSTHSNYARQASIFGKPRLFTQISFIIIKRTKFKQSILEDECKSIVNKRRELTPNENGDATFPTDREVCGTFVTTVKRFKDTSSVSVPILLRSYDNTKKGWSQEVQSSTMEGSRHQTDRTRTETSLSGANRALTQPSTVKSPSGEAHKWPIWKVALAATAVPLYFGTLGADAHVNGMQKKVEYVDGGLHEDNNPTREGIREVESLSSLGTVVSIGTSRGDVYSRISIKRIIQQHINEGSNPEGVHQAVTRKMRKRRKPYYRFNNPGALSMALDEWKPRGPFTKEPGSQTRKAIKESFDKWVPENMENLRDCAKELVKRRRERSNDYAKWEHFAHATRYWCQVKPCNATAAFIDRDEFLKHFRHEHGNKAPGASEEEIIKEHAQPIQWQYQEAPGS
ncbi:MAG: hypothetical protein M1822_005757 [Bathelium mastoideum]|nr:MAG: hypothetical protein M1822_005757 [Bathelium mastoideum]